MTLLRRAIAGGLLLVVAAVGYFALAWVGAFGRLPPAGEVTAAPRPATRLRAEAAAQAASARGLGAGTERRILFGDLHVHTTYSVDAFLRSLPVFQGEGAHPPADACDFARFCSALDFFSINDHAEGLSPELWEGTVGSIRQCAAVSGEEGGAAAGPDLVPFLGWEWTQMASDPADHFGHKNVVLRGLDEVPARPIAARGAAFDGMRQRGGSGALSLMAAVDFAHRQHYYDFAEVRRRLLQTPVCEEGVHVRDLPRDCAEAVATPAGLFRKLDEWGLDALVIPHGNAWGNTTPAGVTWAKQLGAQHDPARQTLIEVYSGHGNSEPWRRLRHVATDAEGEPACPRPTPGFEPECWRAGEIIRERCLAAGLAEAECEGRAAEARANHVFAGSLGHLTVPGQRVEDWLDAGQCRDCFQPAYQLRPGGSVQHALQLARPGLGERGRLRFGLIASSDTHTARAGTGYKEVAPTSMSDAYPMQGVERRSRLQLPRGEPEPRSRFVDPAEVLMLPGGNAERSASFYYTGGLVAVHAAGRGRDAIWRALARREVYGTSGPRILLWFDLLNPPGGGTAPMGSAVTLAGAPRFRVRAAGARVQQPGCPEHVSAALGPARLESLCRDECHHPGDERHPITRIEVVRIRPGNAAGETPADRIEDPWRVLQCAGDAEGCVAEFSDPDFASAGRDAVYYVRAIQAPTPQINGARLECERDAVGRCLRVVDRCRPGSREDPDDDCLAPDEARAWSSPIFLDTPRP